MAGMVRVPNPMEMMRTVQPRSGFPVQNQGGMPRTPTTAPPKPFVTAPTVEEGPPGPAPQPGLTTTAGLPTGARNFGPGGPAPGGAQPVPLPGGKAPTPGTSPTGPATATAPGGAPPPPPTPTPAPPPASTSSTTRESGQTGVISSSPQAPWNLENQLNDFLGQAFNASVTPEFINRAKQDVFRNVQGQTRAATNQINDDAVRRGLFRSGIPAESIANVQGQAQGAMARGVADVLNAAEQQNIQGRQNAAGVASNLLGLNRDWERWQTERADQQRARAAANAPRTFRYQDPDTLEWYDMDESWF